MVRWMRWAAVGVALVVGAAACGDDGGSTTASPKAKPKAETTLTIGTTDPRGRPASDDVQEFADQVGELSGGRIAAKVVWNVGEGEDHRYEYLVEQVRSGKLDLGLVPAGTWDAVGVTSLRALQAPFLVTSESLVDDVVTSDLAERMLAGLGAADVVGLTLLPETLRHPVAFGEPMTSPAQFQGTKIRVPVPSTAAFELVRALGAEPVIVDGDAWADAVDSGEVVGADSAFAQRASLPALGTFTGNVTFYPKVNSLVVGQTAFDGLDADDQAVLRQAAAATQEYVLGSNPSDAEEAAAYCKDGGGVALASTDEVAAFEALGAPVVTALEVDPGTKQMIAELRALWAAGGDAASSAVTACERRSG